MPLAAIRPAKQLCGSQMMVSKDHLALPLVTLNSTILSDDRAHNLQNKVYLTGRFF